MWSRDDENFEGDAEVFLMKVPEHLRAIQCESLLSTLPTRNDVRFLYCEPKMQ